MSIIRINIFTTVPVNFENREHKEVIVKERFFNLPSMSSSRLTITIIDTVAITLSWDAASYKEGSYIPTRFVRIIILKSDSSL